MKKIIIVLLILITLSLIFNVSAFSNESKLKIESEKGIIEIDPLY